MKIAKLLLGTSTTLSLGVFGFAFYTFPDIRNDPLQLLTASKRIVRCAYHASHILYDYKVKVNGGTSEVHERSAKRTRQGLEKNAGLYIKFGQALGQSGHVLPKEWTKQMEPLCQKAPQSSYQDVRKTIEEDFNLKVEDLFEGKLCRLFLEFQTKPVASASLAQVHKAKLKSTGETVAVKVQHRGLKEQCKGDINLAKIFLKIIAVIFPDFEYGWIGEQFDKNIPRELNFRLEGKNCQRCAEQFKDEPHIVAPSVYWDYTSTRVLTMSFEEGTSITYLPKIKEEGLDLREIARLLSTAFAKQIFLHGFVHCDPHPGNIFVRKAYDEKLKKNVPELVMLDHGLYTELDQQSRLDYAMLWRGLLTQDQEMIKVHSRCLGTQFYQMLASMVVSKSYDKIMAKGQKYKSKSRLGKQFDDKEREELKEFVHQNHRKVMLVLQNLNKDVVLLFRANEFVRSLDAAIGCPINTFEITAKYTWEAVKDTHKFTMRERMKTYALHFYFSFLKLYYWMRTMFVADQEIENFIF